MCSLDFRGSDVFSAPDLSVATGGCDTELAGIIRATESNSGPIPRALEQSLGEDGYSEGPRTLMTRAQPEISPLTLNRLSLYLRCLRLLESETISRISSADLADRFDLSSAQIRKDLTQFGEFGVRGVGYDVSLLAARLHELLKLDGQHLLLVVGVGNLGSALSAYLGFNDSSFRVVAGVDSDPSRIGSEVGTITVRPLDDLELIVAELGIDIGVLAIPPEAALDAYQRLVEAGVSSILNFVPVQLPVRRGVRVKNVDFRIYLEELAFFSGRGDG